MVDTPEVIDDFIFKRPVVAIASKLEIVDVAAVKRYTELVEMLGPNSNFYVESQGKVMSHH
ncbi:hypothetical protein P4S68_16270 [Pseudoalteromonas sp. Hal099]